GPGLAVSRAQSLIVSKSHRLLRGDVERRKGLPPLGWKVARNLPEYYFTPKPTSMANILDILKDTDTLIIQQIQCVRTASELDGGATKLLYGLASTFAIRGSQKPEAVGNIWSVSQEEWENQKEAVEDWVGGIKKLGKPGRS